MMYFSDSIGVQKKDSSVREFTKEGYLLLKSIPIARTGIQEYPRSDIIDQGRIPQKYSEIDIFKFNRPESEVFSQSCLDSISNKDISVHHPKGNRIDIRNSKSVSIGHVAGNVGRQGDKIVADLLIKDESGIRAIESGIREVSLGYRSKINWCDSEEYHAEMSDIEVNHVAIVKRARGGDKLRIGDSMGRQITIGTRSFDVTDEQYIDINDSLNVINESIKSKDKRINELESEIVSIKDAASKLYSQDDVMGIINDRVNIIDSARSINPEIEVDGKSNRQIKEECIKHISPSMELSDNVSDDYVDGMFFALKDSASSNKKINIADSLGRPKSSQLNDAYQTYLKNLKGGK